MMISSLVEGEKEWRLKQMHDRSQRLHESLTKDLRTKKIFKRTDIQETIPRNVKHSAMQVKWKQHEAVRKMWL